LCGQEEHEDEEECTNTQHRAPLESLDDDTLLLKQQELVRCCRRQMLADGGKKAPAATAPPTQSDGTGRVSAGREADCEAASGDKAKFEGDMLSDDVELPETASPASQKMSSRFRGDKFLDKVSRRWRAQIRVQGFNKHLGCFGYEEAAARAYDEAAIQHGWLDQLNFDDCGRPSASTALKRKLRSRFRGVSWDKTSRKWRVQLRVQGSKKYIGCFVDEEAAARAYDKVAVECGLLDQVNFELPKTASASPAPQQEISRFQGICWDKRDSKWIARVTMQGVVLRLGRFDDKEAAARAYNKAAIECGLLDQLNIDDYDLPSASPASQPIPGSLLVQEEKKMESAIESARFQEVFWAV
jgi:hypothetical protein